MAKSRNPNGGAKPGGGIKSRVNVSPRIRTGQDRREINPRAVSQIGSALGNKATDHAGVLKGSVEEFVGPKKPISTPLGNQVALNVGCGGPGTGREVMRSGSQRAKGRGQPRTTTTGCGQTYLARISLRGGR
jgi:hypothetical protein